MIIDSGDGGEIGFIGDSDQGIGHDAKIISASVKEKPRPKGRGFEGSNPLRSVSRNHRRVEVIVQAGAEDVFLDLGRQYARPGPDDVEAVGGLAEIDIQIFGLGSPVRSEQVQESEGRFDAGAGRPAGPGL
jgi:hypothetical protein